MFTKKTTVAGILSAHLAVLSKLRSHTNEQAQLAGDKRQQAEVLQAEAHEAELESQHAAQLVIKLGALLGAN